MIIPLEVYRNALPQLQAEYDSQKLGSYTLTIEYINGLDLFYSDGSARDYKGKIVEFDVQRNYGYTQEYFTETGLVYSPKTPKTALYQKWILDTTRKYLESSKQ